MRSLTPGARQRVLLLNSSADVFGSERALCDLAAGLTALGHDVMVVVPENGPAVAEFHGAGITTVVCDFPVMRRSRGVRVPFDIARAFDRPPHGVVRLARDFRATVVYSNTSHVLVGPGLARGVGVPHVWHVREIERVPVGVRRGWGKVLRATGTVIAISRAVAVNLFNARALRRDLDRRVHVVHDGIDTRSFQFRPQRSDGPTAVVVLPGRITPWKGHELAIAAITASNAPVALEIVGAATTAEDAAFRDRVIRPLVDHASNVEMVGLIDKPVVVYQRADFLLQASIAEEPFGRTVLEAMACGVVPIVPDRGGPAEVVRHGVDGFVYRFGDGTSMRQTIERAVSHDPGELLTMAHSARRRVESCFSAERNARIIANRVLGG